MTDSAKPNTNVGASAVTLYLRTDGTLLVVQGSLSFEVYLTPAQLVDLALTQIGVAIRLDPTLGGRALEVLMNTEFLLPIEEVPQCSMN